MEITTQHGALEGKTQSKLTQFCNLDAIISVGYRVNSQRATHFRKWATGVLKEDMIKGLAMDDDKGESSNAFQNGNNPICEPIKSRWAGWVCGFLV